MIVLKGKGCEKAFFVKAYSLIGEESWECGGSSHYEDVVKYLHEFIVIASSKEEAEKIVRKIIDCPFIEIESIKELKIEEVKDEPHY